LDIRYAGFEVATGCRIYRFQVKNDLAGAREFTVRLGTGVFCSTSLRFQDGPDICYGRLKQKMEAETEASHVDDQITICDQDIKEYLEHHRPRGRSESRTARWCPVTAGEGGHLPIRGACAAIEFQALPPTDESRHSPWVLKLRFPTRSDGVHLESRRCTMARGNQTFQKRQRENKLREKAQKKRERRQQKQTEKKQAQALGTPEVSEQAVAPGEGVDGGELDAGHATGDG
jgi:hypothetical protein